MNFPTQEATNKKKPKRLMPQPDRTIKVARINPLVFRTLKYKPKEHVIVQTDAPSHHPKLKGMLSAKKIQSFFDYASREISALMAENNIKECDCCFYEEAGASVFTFDITRSTVIEISVQEFIVHEV
jgi:hypothetical protein